MIRTGILLVAALALSACATVGESQCRGGDWRQIGVTDGERGAGPEQINEYAQTCVKYGTRPDQAAYEAGRHAGLARYCTPESAFQVGAVGDAYLGVCPKESEPQFLAALKRGRLLRPTTPELQFYFASVDELEPQLAAARTDAERANLRARLVQQQWWIQHWLTHPNDAIQD